MNLPLTTDDERSEPKQEEFSNNQAYGFDADDDELAKPTRQDRNDSAAIPVKATVVMPPNPPPQSAQPVAALSDDDFDEFERGTVSDRTADAEAFTADLAAILRGEKTYEPPAETPAPPAPAPQPQPQPAPQSQAQSVAPKKASPHDIFDQMGRNMAHATAFDLGTFSLEQRFDEFDRLLAEQESESLAYTEDDSESEDENTSTKAQSFDFDDEELAADVAALSADEPWQAVQFGSGGSKAKGSSKSSAKEQPIRQTKQPSQPSSNVTVSAAPPTTSPGAQSNVIDGPYGKYEEETLKDQQLRIDQVIADLNEKTKASEQRYIPIASEKIIGRSGEDWPESMKTIVIAVWPDQAAQVVKLVLPKLCEMNVSHKIVDQLETYATDPNPEQYGKYITIYTTGVSNLQGITREINRILSQMIGKQIIKKDHQEKTMPKSEGDYSLGETRMITTRYGSFTGEKISIDGKLIDDNRQIVYPSSHEQSRLDFQEIEKFNKGLN